VPDAIVNNFSEFEKLVLKSYSNNE